LLRFSDFGRIPSSSRFQMGGYRLFSLSSCLRSFWVTLVPFSRLYLGGHRLSRVCFSFLALLCHEAITLHLWTVPVAHCCALFPFRDLCLCGRILSIHACALLLGGFSSFLLSAFRTSYFAFRFLSLQEVSGLRPDKKSLYDFNQFPSFRDRSNMLAITTRHLRCRAKSSLRQPSSHALAYEYTL